MLKNIKATLGMFLCDFFKSLAAMIAMGFVTALLFGTDEYGMNYNRLFFALIVVAGMASLFFTSAGVYQSISLSFGNTRKDYFWSVQIYKIFCAAVVFVIILLVDKFIFRASQEISFTFIISGILGLIAIFSSTELFGFLTLKIGKWGLALMAGFGGIVGGITFGVSINDPLIISKLSDVNSTTILISALCAIVFSALTYLLSRKYCVRG